MTEYDLIVGFEIHTELKTETKIFCGCSVEFGTPPNTNVCPVCLGLPGSLPVLNKKAVDFSLRAAMALNCDIPEISSWDRKNYYYPDLPKNYQISQDHACLGTGGWMDVPLDEGESLRIRINNIHLEEDAGKLMHPEEGDDDVSVVDLNRAGTPLLEIVTEPDFRTMDECKAFMAAMRNLLRYIDISDCKMQEGSLRFEANISVRPTGTEALGKKVEIKNLNSVRTVLKCIEHEYNRQCDLLDEGGEVLQETRLWDEVNSRTVAMRSKEVANDYRYFPDPDLVPVVLTEDWKGRVQKALPELPAAKRVRFVEEHGIPDYDAGVLTADRSVADYFESVVKHGGQAKQASNWIMTGVLAVLNERDCDVEDLPVGAEQLANMIALVQDGTISGNAAKKVFAEMLENGGDPKDVVEKLGLLQISDTSAIEAILDRVIADNPQVAEDYANGKDAAKGRLVGGVMKASQGKANPQVINDLIDKKLRG